MGVPQIAPKARTNQPRARFKPNANYKDEADAVCDAVEAENGHNDVDPGLYDVVHVVAEKKVPSALEPKVMAPYETPPGDTPRRVQIERKKRLFAHQDLSALLDEQGVNSFVNQPSGLELAYFDDQEFDTRTFHEWVFPEALAQGVKCQVAKYPELNGPPTWEPATITDGAQSTNEYHVKMAGGKTTSVPRIDVYFLAEDPFHFVKRRVNAHKLRQETRPRCFTTCMWTACRRRTSLRSRWSR